MIPARPPRSSGAFPRQFVLYPLVVAGYSWVLHWSYSELVSPSFSYLGYRYTEPTAEATLFAWLITTCVAFALPLKVGRPSGIMLWILYVVTVAPSILMAPYTSYLDDATALTLSLVVGGVYVVVALFQRPAPRALAWSVSPTSLWLVLGLFSVATYLLLVFTQGISVRSLNILDVYDVRAEYADEVRDVGLLGYLVTTQANVVNPIIVARGMVTRRWTLVAIAVFGQFVLYSTTGFKHMLFAILAWLVMYLLLRRRGGETRGSALLWGAAALILVSALIDEAAESNIMTSLFSRRFILTPGAFTSVYVKFFSENPQVHLGHSILRPFVDYPYDQTPPYVIGVWLAGDRTMAANANLFADGYANFGWLGMFGAGAVLLVYLKIVDRAAVGLPVIFSALVVVIPAVALSNTSVLTAMLSHGLLAAVVLLALVPRDTPSDFLPGRRRYYSTQTDRIQMGAGST